jgi:transposase-like protein
MGDDLIFGNASAPVPRPKNSAAEIRIMIYLQQHKGVLIFSMKNESEIPKTLQGAIVYFSDADVALNFAISIRWPDGVKCPRCGSAHVSFTSKRRVWTCEDCEKRQQFSAKVGTIMEDSPLPLDKWLTAIRLISTAKNGISSYEIHRALGVTQKTAWFLGHRIRLALHSGTF